MVTAVKTRVIFASMICTIHSLKFDAYDSPHRYYNMYLNDENNKTDMTQYTYKNIE